MVFPKFIKIAVIPLRHIIEVDNVNSRNPKLSRGVEASVIEFLSSALGFKYRIFVTDDREWGRFTENGTWTGVVGMVHDNETDLGFGYMTVTTNRSEAVDFIPYSIEEYTFATNFPPVMSKAGSYAQPFQWQVWMILFLLATFMPIIFKVLMSKKVSLQRLAFEMIGCFVYKPFCIPLTRTRDRFLLGSWFVFVVLISSGYAAVLLSYLSVPLRDRGIRTIKQLATVVSEGKFKCLANRGTAGIALLKDSHDEDLRKIGNNIIERDWFSRGKTVRLPKHIEKSVALLGARSFFHLEYGEEPFANKHIFEDTIASWNVGIAVSKEFCCKKELTAVVSRVVETGIYKKLYNNVLHKTKLGLELDDGLPPHFVVLTLHDLTGAFVFLGTGYLLAFICLLFELVSVE
ncbi:lig_chan-Glu_bd domain-containing protein [Trichonephila clavata]|uniref:Lig_chan-Glu_bd domain-containing protein n=1 Tax=Trichonephila clavata TaxID=2740835 RepID=A0A8X6LMM2_TRICU|nr:lig_chan-Glu_bd domain-containing protein [Trichonephila clavata]